MEFRTWLCVYVPYLHTCTKRRGRLSVDYCTVQVITSGRKHKVFCLHVAFPNGSWLLFLTALHLCCRPIVSFKHNTNLSSEYPHHIAYSPVYIPVIPKLPNKCVSATTNIQILECSVFSQHWSQLLASLVSCGIPLHLKGNSLRKQKPCTYV